MAARTTASGFEPLAAMDRQFLELEDENAHMHVAGFSLYELDPLRGDAGGLDMGAFRRAIEAALGRIPRYRQKLAYTPIEGHPVWIDDEDFDLDYHLRHVSSPPPGRKQQLEQLIGWIVGQRLDHARPLWEMWIVEGVDDGKQFAVVTKMHHCMIDGGAGVNLMQLLMRSTPEFELPETWPHTPRRAPSRTELATYELGRRLSTPTRLLRGALGVAADARGLTTAVEERLGAFGELLQNIRPASQTPISGIALGPHRRVAWHEMPLDALTKLRAELGCSLNDLVLAIVAGAVRRYLERRRVPLQGLDFRVSIPVDVRTAEERDQQSGNRISSWIVPLPLDEPSPLAQLASIQKRTSELKSSNQAIAVEMMMAAAEEIPGLLSLSKRALSGQISMVVTNVPGPQIPLYLLGCRALNMQPLVPLIPGVGIGVALLSYDGKLFWGFQADYDSVPDLHDFVRDVCEAHRAIGLSSIESAAHAGRKKAAPEAATSDDEPHVSA